MDGTIIPPGGLVAIAFAAAVALGFVAYAIFMLVRHPKATIATILALAAAAAIAWLVQREQHRAHQRTLGSAGPITVHGTTFPAGTTIEPANPGDGGATGVVIRRPTVIDGVPIGSLDDDTQVELDAAGHLLSGYTPYADFTYDGYACAGGRAAYFGGGKLESCTLRRIAYVHGIPCGNGELTYSLGRCVLGAPYRKGTITFAPGSSVQFQDMIVVVIGATPPDIRLYGRPLQKDDEVDFASNGTQIRRASESSPGCAFRVYVIDRSTASDDCDVVVPPSEITYAAPSTR